jgi:hypothetical protein
MMRSWLIMSLTAVLMFGCALPALATPTSPPASGTLLFKDDFSSPASGWDHSKYEEGIMDYDGGGYRMLINSLNANYWSTAHKDFTDVRVEVDAGKLGGPDENRIGLICRSDGKSYYFFMISSDGYYGLGIFRNGKAALMGQDQMQLNSAIHTGMAVNHLRVDCKGNDLTGFVNGLQLAAAHDSTLKHGDVGLLAGTFHQPGADIVFDNFVVFVP